jgi:hypothetical protein
MGMGRALTAHRKNGSPSQILPSLRAPIHRPEIIGTPIISPKDSTRPVMLYVRAMCAWSSASKDADVASDRVKSARP